jgi:hypothetical protein
MSRTFNADFCGDTFNYAITPSRVKSSHMKKSMHKLAQQIFNNKSLRAKNRIRKVARQFAVVTLR